VMVILEDSRYNMRDASTAMAYSKSMPHRRIPMEIAPSKSADVTLSRWFHCVSRCVRKRTVTPAQAIAS
jgi:hypothetical protein